MLQLLETVDPYQETFFIPYEGSEMLQLRIISATFSRLARSLWNSDGGTSTVIDSLDLIFEFSEISFILTSFLTFLSNLFNQLPGWHSYHSLSIDLNYLTRWCNINHLLLGLSWDET